MAIRSPRRARRPKRTPASSTTITSRRSAGRFFDERDLPNGQQVVIIGKTIADRLFGGRDPVGMRLRYPSVQVPPITIVGVVGDVKITGLDQAVRPVLYYPYRQNAGT